MYEKNSKSQNKFPEMDKYKCPFWKVCTDKNGVVAMSKNITYKILFFYKNN